MTRSVKERTTPVRVGVYTPNPEIVDAWNASFSGQKLSNGRPVFDLTPMQDTNGGEEDSVAKGMENVRTKQWDAFAVIHGDIAQEGNCELHTMRGFDMVFSFDLRRGLQDAVRQERLKKEGLDPSRIGYLTRGIEWNEFEVAEAPAAEGADTPKRKKDFNTLFAPAMVCLMMMFFLTLTTSQRLLRGVVEEKTSRVVEILLSSLSPTELLAGKVLGFYVVGLIQFACWVGIGAIALQSKQVDISGFIPPMYFLQFLVFLTTGYLFFASVFAAVGAIVGDETESHQLQGILTLPIIIPMMFNFVFITQPNWWVVRLASYVPFFTPAVMSMRLIAAPIPWWETLSIALTTVVFAVLGILAAARIFRVGILMTGKRPALRELWKWCFHRDVEAVMER